MVVSPGGAAAQRDGAGAAAQQDGPSAVGGSARVVEFRVENVGRLTADKVKKLLGDAGVPCRRVRRDGRKTYALVGFSSREEGEAWLSSVNALAGGKPGTLLSMSEQPCEPATSASEPGEARDGAAAPGRPVTATAQEATAPLYGKVSYTEQLIKKQKQMAKVLIKVARELTDAEMRTEAKAIPKWLQDRPKKVKHRGQGGSAAAAEVGANGAGADVHAHAHAHAHAGPDADADASADADADGPGEPPNKRLKPEAHAPAPSEVLAERDGFSHEAMERRMRVMSLPKPWLDPEFGAVMGWTGEIRNACCRLEPICPSPVIEGYRNKCEFTIGANAEGLPVVGFRLGGWRSGAVMVGEVTATTVEGGDADLQTIAPTTSPAMIELAQRVQAWLRQPGRLPVFDLTLKTGFWRTVMVRHFASTNQLMTALTCKLGAVDAAAARAELHALREHLTAVKYAGAELLSFGVTWFEGDSSPDPNDPSELLWGQSHIYDELNGVRYAVNARAFFQVNSSAAEVLYKQVRDWAVLPPRTPGAAPAADGSEPRTTLFDVCCGTGTIGLSMANDFSSVVGVDMNTSAIEDAKTNAKMLGYTNTVFVAAPAEQIMRAALSKFSNQDEMDRQNLPDLRAARALLLQGHTTAVVDPPRGGLHPKVVRELRLCEAVQRIVYVSCNPQGSFVDDAVALCRKEHKQRPGTPFRPVLAMPIDLFPHTEHCELVVLLERVRPDEA